MASEVNFSCFDRNLSRDSATVSVWSLDPRVQTDTASRYTITTLTSLLLLVGLPSNLLVMVVILKKGLVKKQPTVLLLLNMAVTDLLVCLLVMPLNIGTLIAGEFKFGEDDYTRCQVCQTGVIFVVLSLVTLCTLAVVALDRLVYLKAPMHYSKLVTHKKILTATVLIWCLSVAVTIPTLFGFNEMRFSTAIGLCTIAFSGSTYLTRNSYYLILLGLFLLLPIGTLLVTNVWGMCIIQRKIRAKSRSLRLERDTHRQSFHKRLVRHHQGMQVRLIKVYTAIFVTNLVTYLPIIVRIILGVVAEEEEFSQAVRITGSIAYLALLSQAVAHPLVQASLIGEVRKGISTQLSSMAEKVRELSRSEVSISTLKRGCRTLEKGSAKKGRKVEIHSLPPQDSNTSFTEIPESERRGSGQSHPPPEATAEETVPNIVVVDTVDSPEGRARGSGLLRSALCSGDPCCNVFCGCGFWDAVSSDESPNNSQV